jgi:hypothetical protein
MKECREDTADLKSAMQSTQHAYLHQHFIGWFVKTEHPVFDADSALMMDFSVEQRGNTRFMYVLPTSPQEALVEYTLFSDTLLSEREYEQAISEYLEGLQAGDGHTDEVDQVVACTGVDEVVAGQHHHPVGVQRTGQRHRRIVLGTQGSVLRPDIRQAILLSQPLAIVVAHRYHHRQQGQRVLYPAAC